MTGFNDLKFLLGLAFGVLLSAIVIAFKKQLERALDSLLSKVPLTISKFIRYRRWEKKYRKVIYEEHRHLKFVGVKHSIVLNRPKLEDVFVNLEMQAAAIGVPSPNRSELTLHETLNLNVALKKFTHLAILGNPGAGKTTLFEYILRWCYFHYSVFAQSFS
jgi:predicted NACHT family NTPase